VAAGYRRTSSVSSFAVEAMKVVFFVGLFWVAVMVAVLMWLVVLEVKEQVVALVLVMVALVVVMVTSLVVVVLVMVPKAVAAGMVVMVVACMAQLVVACMVLMVVACMVLIVEVLLGWVVYRTIEPEQLQILPTTSYRSTQ